LLQGDDPVSPVGRATRAQRQQIAAENPREKTTWLAAVKQEKEDLNADTSQEEGTKRPLENCNLNSTLEEPVKNQRAKGPYEEQSNVQHQEESEEEVNSVDSFDQNDGDTSVLEDFCMLLQGGGERSLAPRKDLELVLISRLLHIAVINMQHRREMELRLFDIIFAAQSFGFSGFEHAHDELFDVRKTTGMHLSTLELALYNSDYHTLSKEMLDHRSSAAPCPKELGKIGRESIANQLSNMWDSDFFTEKLVG
jgi:hypothetical protein